MITLHVFYFGEDNKARLFAEEMENSGLANEIRNEEGNLRYEYFYPRNEDNAVLLIDSWVNQEALDIHHELPVMDKIAKLREKYDLHMKVEKFVSIDIDGDSKFIRK